MDSRKLSPQGKKLESHLSQEHRRPPLGRTAAWGQPSTQSSAQQGLQTQDWVCEPPERRRPGRHWSVSIDERRRLAMRGGRERPGAAGAPLHYRVRGGGSSQPGPSPTPPVHLASLHSVQLGPVPCRSRAPPLSPSRPPRLPDPPSPAGHRADGSPAGVGGRGQGRAVSPPAEVQGVHQRLPGLPVAECAFLA
uniref:Uncharacterized protein n=1 Tax=Piliocolobus tephrosceles TaxID=591936 RepID=A0A8C9I8X2_9PRIM